MVKIKISKTNKMKNFTELTALNVSSDFENAEMIRELGLEPSDILPTIIFLDIESISCVMAKEETVLLYTKYSDVWEVSITEFKEKIRKHLL